MYLSKINYGFTLVELMIVISIIAVLATGGAAVYSNTQRQGRDAKRLNDLRTIEAALEQYELDQGFYPLPSVVPGQSLTNATGNPSVPSNTRIYLNQIPQDPTQAGIPNKDYQYWSLNWTPSGGYQNCNNTNAICNFFLCKY